MFCSRSHTFFILGELVKRTRINAIIGTLLTLQTGNREEVLFCVIRIRFGKPSW